MRIELDIPDELLALVPGDVAEWVLEQLAESKAVFAERDRLIGFHADRLGNGKLFRGCQHLVDYVAAEHESVRDLTDLNCPIPQIRQLYNIAVANAPPKLKHPQFFVVS